METMKKATASKGRCQQCERRRGSANPWHVTAPIKETQNIRRDALGFSLKTLKRKTPKNTKTARSIWIRRSASQPTFPESALCSGKYHPRRISEEARDEKGLAGFRPLPRVLLSFRRGG